MTLKEAEELREQNLARTLRMPNCLQFIDEDDMAQRTNIRWGVCYIIKKYVEKRPFGKKSMLLKTALKNARGVEDFYGAGTKDWPFHIKTKWGSGCFYDAHEVFKGAKYPNYIEKLYCFSNCYFMAKEIGETNNLSCKVLGGIAYIKDYPILHAVVETEDGYIIDFNYDIVMEKELYFSLFAFEPLSELTSQEIFVKDRLLNKYRNHIKNYGHGYRVFALDDLIEYAEQRDNNEVESREPIQNF